MSCGRAAAWALGVLALATISSASQAQTLTVLHSFSGGADGAAPLAGLSADQAGNLYGTASIGGSTACTSNSWGNGCGTVFELARRPSGWIFTTLYTFQGDAVSDGENPAARVLVGPHGRLYGTTVDGGGGSGCLFGTGCGLVFSLAPPPSFCHAVFCSWTETVLYRFSGARDGASPYGEVTFDAPGNLYGTTYFGGIGAGVAYELSPRDDGWQQNVLHTFQGGVDGRHPFAGLVLDQQGNLYGTAAYGGPLGCYGNGCGTVFELSPAMSGWTETTLYTFQGASDGGNPYAGVVFDNSGNLYGATYTPQNYSGGGTAYELNPVNSGWSFTLVYSFPSQISGGSEGPAQNLVPDAAGNLYGTTYQGGTSGCNEAGCGTVFKLTPSNGGWSNTVLHNFTGGTDGGGPRSNLVIDSAGNLYGTTAFGGQYDHGVVFEIIP